MHEQSLMNDLLRKIEAVAREQGARKVISVKVRLGGLSHISADHLREHFSRAAQGTLAEGAKLEAEVLSDPTDSRAEELFLESVDLEA